MANVEKFLDDYEDMDDNDLYAEKISNKESTRHKRFKARRRIEELREMKSLKQLDPYYYE